MNNLIRGFSLVELLVSTAILSVGFLGMIKLQTMMISGNSIAEQRSVATQLAQQKIEQFRGFETLDVEEGKFAYDDITTGNDSVTGKNTSYARTWNVVALENPERKVVTVNIAWNAATGEQFNIAQTTVINGVNPSYSGGLIDQTSLPVFPGGRSVHPSIPIAVINQSDGTSDYTPLDSPSLTISFDNDTGRVLTINDVSAYSVEGNLAIADGSLSPGDGFAFSNVTVQSVDSAGVSHCDYNNATGKYTCYMTIGWNGYIGFTPLVDGSAQFCTNASQPYENLLANVYGDNYLAVNSTGTVPAPPGGGHGGGSDNCPSDYNTPQDW